MQEQLIFLAGGAGDALTQYLSNQSLSEAVKGPRIERRLTGLRLRLGLQSDLVRQGGNALFYEILAPNLGPGSSSVLRADLTVPGKRAVSLQPSAEREGLNCNVFN